MDFRAMAEPLFLSLALPFAMQAAAGAVGGNIAGMIRRTEGWGPLINTLIGAAGGLAAAQAMLISGYAAQAAAWLAGNMPALEAGVAAGAGMLVGLASSAFKQPD